MTELTFFRVKILNICLIWMKFVAGKPILNQALPVFCPSLATALYETLQQTLRENLRKHPERNQCAAQ